MSIKKEIQNIANELIQSNDIETKRFGKIIIKYIFKIYLIAKDINNHYYKELGSKIKGL